MDYILEIKKDGAWICCGKYSSVPPAIEDADKYAAKGYAIRIKRQTDGNNGGQGYHRSGP